jgi:hypothetical protein
MDSGSKQGSSGTLYHFADVRLGGAFPFLEDSGNAHRAHLRDVFTRVVDVGLELAPTAVLISGNLLGTQFPTRDLSEFTRTQIARFSKAGIPVLVAAGPLDALHERIYASGTLDDLEHVTVFPSMPKAVTVREAGRWLSVVGVSWSAMPVGPDFLAGVAAHRSQGRATIGLCALAWPQSEDDKRLLRRQVGASSAAYLALGGSAVKHNVSTDKVVAWCPGAPELVAPEEGEGSPLLVNLANGDVTAKPVAKRRFGRFTLQPVAYANSDDLAASIRALADANLAAMVRLTGGARINQFIDTEEIRARLAAEFLALDVVDESRPTLEDVGAAAYPELSVAGKFLNVVRAEMERATTEEGRRRAGAALRLGLALLEGRIK